MLADSKDKKLINIQDLRIPLDQFHADYFLPSREGEKRTAKDIKANLYQLPIFLIEDLNNLIDKNILSEELKEKISKLEKGE